MFPAVKLFTCLAAITTSVWVGRLPLNKEGRFLSAEFLDKMHHLVDGIFLGIALTHLLPESFKIAQSSQLNHLLPALITAAVFFLFWYQNKMTYTLLRTRQTLAAYFLFSMISAHAFIEGMVVGLSNDLMPLTVLILALIIHKGPESFAVVMNLKRHSISRKKTVIMLILFSTLTPIGILTSMLSNHETAPFLELTINSVAAGTFLFMAYDCQSCPPSSECDEAHDSTCSIHKNTRFHNFCYLVAGFSIMALISHLEILITWII